MGIIEFITFFIFGFIVGACGYTAYYFYRVQKEGGSPLKTGPADEGAAQHEHVGCVLKAIEQSGRKSVGIYWARDAYLRQSLEDFTQIVSACGDVNYESGGIVSDKSHCKNATLLHECIKDGAYEFASVLIGHGADPNVGLDCVGERTEYESLHCTPLHSAVQGGRIDLVELLIKAGADHSAVDGNGNTPLCVAATNDNIAIAKILLAAGANPNSVHETEICPLLCTKSNAMAKLLVSQGADVNMMFENGYPLLSFLIFKRKPNIARFLLKNYSYSFDFRDGDGELLERHPLWVAYFGNWYEIFKDLADVSYFNQPGAFDRGILEVTVINDNCEYARVLLERMLRGNFQIDSELLYLAKSRRMQEMLVQFGADPTIKNPEYGKKTSDEYMVYLDRKFVWRDLADRAPRIVAEHQRKLLADAVGLEDEPSRVKRRM